MIVRHVTLANPVADQDFRTRLRAGKSILFLVFYPCLLGMAEGAFLVARALSGTQSLPAAGLFPFLIDVELILLVLVTPVVSAGGVSGDRERRTWDIWLMTRLSAMELLWGKWLAAIAFNGLLLLTTLPLWAPVFLIDSVSTLDALGVLILLFCLQIFMVTVSILLSSISRRSLPAMLSAAGIGCLILGLAAFPAPRSLFAVLLLLGSLGLFAASERLIRPERVVW